MVIYGLNQQREAFIQREIIISVLKTMSCDYVMQYCSKCVLRYACNDQRKSPYPVTVEQIKNLAARYFIEVYSEEELLEALL